MWIEMNTYASRGGYGPWATRAVALGVAQKIPLPPLNLEKVHITSLSFRESPLFLPEFQNRAKHLLQLLKPFILPHWPCYKRF
jgi:hypothetical protein